MVGIDGDVQDEGLDGRIDAYVRLGEGLAVTTRAEGGVHSKRFLVRLGKNYCVTIFSSRSKQM